MKESARTFAASQIARALGRKRQAIQRELANTPPSGRVVIGGNAASAWSVLDLPGDLQKELEARKISGGFRSIDDLMQNPSPLWEPAIPLAQVAQPGIDRAAKLQRALRRALSLQNDLSISSAELEEIALRDYSREFETAISDRHVRDLIKRTLERDGGRGEFERLEIYLDEAPARKAQPKAVVSVVIDDQFSELRQVFAGFKDSAAPTAAEKECFWIRCFEVFESEISSGQKFKKVRLALLKFLNARAPFLADGKDALRVSFKRKYEAWLKADRRSIALQDRRSKNSGNHRAPMLGDEDRDKLIAHAVLNCGGRVSQAWRELVERNALSESILSYYTSNPASKSSCPDRIRESVKYEIEMMDDIHHGPRTAKLNGAHLLRDWSGVASMDWLCADDATLEVYFYIPDESGWFTLTRGQLLLMIDVRTTRILGYAMLPEKTYNARAIRTLITKVADEHGLPRKGFYFERGIWEKSRLLKGDTNSEPFSMTEAELGLRSLGLKFVHSRLPRSKPVERVLGAFQDLMDGEPGFVGGNEMKEKFERVQKAKLLVDRRAEHPSKYFYSLDQWIERLDDFCERYNAARQDGKMTEGNSPDVAFEKFQRADDPLIKLPPSCRYLLSHHMRPLNVTHNGITLRFGKQVYNYRNAQTGRLIGQRVLCFFNPELPGILTVTDTNRENAFCIERTQEVPAMDAPAELLEQEQARVASHNEYARTRYRILKTRHAVQFRPVVADAETASLGRQIATQTAEQTERIKKEARQVSAARKASQRLGITLSPTAARRPESVKALTELNQLLNEDESA
ncbi:MAG: hypothetical protein U1F65_05110 [Verrucomicrobiota bacterium]